MTPYYRNQLKQYELVLITKIYVTHSTSIHSAECLKLLEATESFCNTSPPFAKSPVQHLYNIFPSKNHFVEKRKLNS